MYMEYVFVFIIEVNLYIYFSWNNTVYLNFKILDVVGSTIKIGWSKWSCSDPPTYIFMLWEADITKYQGGDRGHNCCSMNVLWGQSCKKNVGKFLFWMQKVLNIKDLHPLPNPCQNCHGCLGLNAVTQKTHSTSRMTILQEVLVMWKPVLSSVSMTDVIPSIDRWCTNWLTLSQSVWWF